MFSVFSLFLWFCFSSSCRRLLERRCRMSCRVLPPACCRVGGFRGNRRVSSDVWPWFVMLDGSVRPAVKMRSGREAGRRPPLFLSEQVLKCEDNERKCRVWSDLFTESCWAPRCSQTQNRRPCRRLWSGFRGGNGNVITAPGTMLQVWPKQQRYWALGRLR